MTFRDWTGRYGINAREIACCGLAGLIGGAALSMLSPAVTAAFTGCLIFSMLVITLADSRRMLIPDIISLPAIPAGLIAAVSCLPGRPEDILLSHASAGMLGAAAFYALRWAYLKLRGRIGLGLGDVKLAAVAGCWVGLGLLAQTLLLAALSALIAAALGSWRSNAAKPQAMTPIPFGSFIAPAIVMTWIYLVLSGL